MKLTMIAADAVVDEILELKKKHRAVILAHHYQDADIQEVADSIGDSLELARVDAPNPLLRFHLRHVATFSTLI